MTAVLDGPALATVETSLAKAHQTAQTMAWDRSLRQLAQAWPLLDFDNLDATQLQWLAANLEIAQSAQGAAGNIAKRYIDQARVLGVGEALPSNIRLESLAGSSIADLAKQMQINGPTFIKSMMATGRTQADISKAAFSITAGDLMKTVMDIPRAAVIEASWVDDASEGVVWVNDAKPCDWCRKLAGWEAKAIQPGTGTGGHAHCGCVYQPVYNRRRR